MPNQYGSTRSLTALRATCKKRGGRLLTRKYSGVMGSYEFECSRKHRWKTTYNKIENSGQWCPICSKGSKSEELLRVALEQILLTNFKRVRPTWLRNRQGIIMELDGYSEELSVAFEYQGRQHYEKVGYLQNHNLNQIQSNDKQKIRICRTRGIKLLVISYKDDYRSFPKVAKKQLKSLGFDVSKYDFTQIIDWNLAYNRADKLEELKNRLASKNITLISKKWLGGTYRYQVKCNVCMEKYEATGNAFMGKKINGCRFCSLKTNNHPSTLKIDIPRRYAKENGGILLSKVYRNMHTKMDWECRSGHQFTSNFNNLVRQERFCSICEDRQIMNQFTEKEALAIFKRNNLKPFEPYQGKIHRWESICIKCQNNVRPSVRSILENLYPPCPYCTGKRFSPKQRLEEMKRLNLKPLEPYVNSTRPWKYQCLGCKTIYNKKFSDIRFSKGCKKCRLI